MYQEYQDRADFSVVYIREAHPTDGWRMAKNDREGIKIVQPQTEDDRFKVARLSAEALKLSIPMVVDNMDDRTETHYGGWPDRMYIVDRGGKIAYKGEKGPRGFKPEEMEVALKKLIGLEKETPLPSI